MYLQSKKKLQTLSKLLLIMLWCFILIGCTKVQEETDKKLKALKTKANTLDSLMIRELNRIQQLDSLVKHEFKKVNALDSLINSTSIKDSLINKSKSIYNAK